MNEKEEEEVEELYCTVLHCTVLYSTVQSLTFPQIPCVRLCENLRVLGLV